MIIEEQRINAHATIRTVAEIITAPYPTKTTIAAMIRRFDIRHPKVTYITMILTKLYRTINAFVATTTDRIKLRECIRRQSRSTAIKNKSLPIGWSVVSRTFYSIVACSSDGK